MRNEAPHVVICEVAFFPGIDEFHNVIKRQAEFLFSAVLQGEKGGLLICRRNFNWRCRNQN